MQDLNEILTNLNMKTGQNRDLNNQNVSSGTPKKLGKTQEWMYPEKPLTFMFKSIEV